MWVGKGNGFRIHGLIKEGVIFCLNVFFTLVHCLSSLLSPAVCPLPIVPLFSASVGCTGTLIAIHSMVKMIEEVEEVDIFNFVLKMRAQRTYMVWTGCKVAPAEGGECSCTDKQALGIYNWLSTYMSYCSTPTYPPLLSHPCCPTPLPTPSCPHRSNMCSSTMPC